MVSTQTGARARIATCPTDQFQLSPASAEARFAFLQWRRQWNPEADDPLFRPVDADDFRVNGDAASDFSNLRQNGLVRITIPLPPNVRLIDPVTNAASNETFVDVWRMVPSVNDVALTGPDMGASVWPRGPNPSGGYQLDARLDTLQEQALGALVNHAQIQQAAPPRLLDDLTSFQRVLFTNHRVRALADAVRTGSPELPDPDPPLNRLERQGKAVFERACAQCHGGPGLSTPGVPGEPIHQHLEPMPAPSRYRVARSVRIRAHARQRLVRNARTYEITLSLPTQGPTGVIPAGSKVRRTSSDPGPRASDRIRWRPRTTGRLGQVRRAGPPRHQPHRAVLPQQQRRHARGSRRSLHRVLQARRGDHAAGDDLTGRLDERYRLGSGSAP